MVMRMVRPADASRVAALVTMGGKLTDKAGLTVACIGSSPRNGDASGKDGPRHNVNDKNQAKQDEPGGPSLAVPIIVRGNSVSIDHHRQGSSGLLPAGAPKLIAK